MYLFNCIINNLGLKVLETFRDFHFYSQKKSIFFIILNVLFIHLGAHYMGESHPGLKLSPD